MTAPLAYLIVFIGVLGHASSELFSVLAGLSGAEVSVWRFMLGALGLIAVLVLSRSSASLRIILQKDGPRLVWLSLLGVSGTYLAFHLALDFATIVQVGTIVTTIPIFVGLANFVINKQPMTAAKLITGCAAIIAIALLFTDGYLARLAGNANALIGITLALICAALASIYAVLVKPLIVRHGALPLTTASMIIGAAGLWLAAGLGWRIWVNPLALAAMDWTVVWPLLVLGFWNTTIAQITWLGGLARVPDLTRGSYLFFLKPVITALLALAFLSQPISGFQWAAIAAICSAVLLEALRPEKPDSWQRDTL
jgi:drug/metabolite transporter (DMT)-like permease